jgi:hypothetical protein
MLKRREFLVGAASASLLGEISPAHAKPVLKGCTVAGAEDERDLVRNRLPSSGNHQVDQICQRAIARLRDWYMPTTFGFFDDSTGANAVAINHTTGFATVLMGKELALSVLKGDDVLVTAVLAHEWGHILQYKGWFIANWGVRWELDADKWAGGYLASHGFDKAQILRAADLFFNLGDCDFSDPDHHGTPMQRRNVFLAGAGLQDEIIVKRPQVESTPSK